MKRRRLIALVLLGLLNRGPEPAWAQAITLSPSLAFSEEYNDNVLLTPSGREADFVSIVSPGLRLAITESPWTVTAAASLQALYYARRPELNSSTANRQGKLGVEFRPTPRLTASLTDTFVRSLDPGEVDPETGIVTGRFASTRNTVTPAISYQVTPLTHSALQYSFTVLRSDSPQATDSDTHEAVIALTHQFTPRTAGTFRYAFSRFEAEGTSPRDAHLPKVGLTHVLSPTIRLSADAGPLFLERSDGTIEVTVGGSLRYEQEFSQGRFALTYDRSARVAGVVGEPATSQGLTASISLSATRDLSVGLDGGVRATESADAAVDFLVYTAGIRLDYRILQWLSLSGGYRYFRQDDQAGPLNLERNVVFLGLTASTDVRVY